jgi:hypothetical protein
MQGVLRAVVVVTVLLWASPVIAQLTSGSTASEPIIDFGYVGLHTGGTIIETGGGVVGAEGGLRVWRHLDAIGGIVWASNVVTRRHLDDIEQLAAHLGQTQGVGASGDLRAPSLYGGLGARWVFEEARFKPYVMLTLGAARTTLKPELRLNGADVTGVANQYGITLGRDLIGRSNDFAAETGLGIVMGYGQWYVDAGARLLSISGNDQRTNVARLLVGGGYRF